MTSFNPEEIEKVIYEAAIVPELWPDALAQTARLADADGGLLFTHGRAGVKWASSENVRDVMRRFLEEGWMERNSRTGGVIERGLVGVPRIVTEADYLAPGQFETDPMINEFLRPLGWGWAAGTMVALPDGDFFTVSIEKRYDRGPVRGEGLERLNALRPHLARAAMFGTRLALEQMRTAVDILGAVGLAAVAVTKGGRALVANAAFQEESRLWAFRGGDKVALVDPTANRQLIEALDSIDSWKGQRSIALRGSDRSVSAIVQVLPVRRRAIDYFQSAQAILVVNRRRDAATADSAIAQAIFDLTAAEARVATLLSLGRSIAEIAAENGTAEATVRNQLKSAMQKTGCHRQAELVKLLGELLPRSVSQFAG